MKSSKKQFFQNLIFLQSSTKSHINYKQGGNNAHKDQTATGRPPAQNASPAMDKAPEKGPHPFIKADRSRLRCDFCHKSGHDISKCFRRQAGPSAPNSAPKATYKVRRTTIKHCLICGDPLHRAFSCEQRKTTANAFKVNRVTAIAGGQSGDLLVHTNPITNPQAILMFKDLLFASGVQENADSVSFEPIDQIA